MRNSELINQITQDRRYIDIARPLGEEFPIDTISDAEFLIHQSGIIFNVEGYYHPTNYVVGEVLYAPDQNGDKNIFGQPYRKVTLHKGTYEPVAYPDRSRILGEIDAAFNQNQNNSYFALYKQILPASDFIAHLSSIKALRRALTLTSGDTEKFQRDFENLMQLLDIRPEEITLGVTGAHLLGNSEHFHDLDIVFRGGLEQNHRIAKKMSELAKYEPQRRLFEGGKGWQIRFFNDLGTVMCNFFTYPNRENAPLHDFSMEIIEHDIRVEGTVGDDQHSIYTPTILSLKDAAIEHEGNVIQRFTDLQLVVYHTASRGDCFIGDVVEANGALVKITEPGKDSYLAVCVIDREGLKNLTPPWKGYYAET